MKVLYSCHACGLYDVSANVRDRGIDEDIKHWFEQVMIMALGHDHYVRNPRCTTKQLSNIKIPLALGSNRIGAGTEH